MPRFIAEEIVHLNLNNSITEIRIRSKNKIIVICSKNEFVLDLIASPKIILDILLNVSKMSIYAIQTDLNNGFVVIRGGHRIGVCGEVVYENGRIKNIKNICSLNIRVARQIFGCADSVMPQIIVNGVFQNTLIVSPPGCGKTTLLRDIIRQISSGVKVIFTMHGDSLKSILENPNIKELLDMNIFSKIILLSSGKIPGIVEKIYDGGAYVTN